MATCRRFVFVEFQGRDRGNYLGACQTGGEETFSKQTHFLVAQT